MLSDIEVEEIKKLIIQGKSDYKIGKELGHSPNTVKKIREKYRESKVCQKKGWEMHFNNPIDNVREVIKNIINILEMGEQKAEERRELEKLLEKLQETLRIEVDVRISKEIADAVEESNEGWRKLFDQDYVKKEVVTDLNSMAKAREDTIENLNNEIEKKDGVLASHQQENEGLKNRISDLQWKNNDLNEKNLQLNYHIENRIDTDVRQWRKNLRHEKEVLNGEKTDFDIYAKRQQSNLNRLFFDSDKNLKSAETYEGELAEQKEKLKKREDKFDKNIKQKYDVLGEMIKSIEKREENVAESEKSLKGWKDEQEDELDAERKKIKYGQEKITQKIKVINKKVEELRAEDQRLQEWQKLLNKTRGFNKFSLLCPRCEKPILFDASKQEIYQKINQTFGNYTCPECRPKSKQQKHVILRPVSLSVEPVIQSGFSPIIQSGLEPIVVECSGEPVVRSGISLIIQSGEELDVFGPNCEPVSQSGVST